MTTSQNSTTDILFILLYIDIAFGNKMEECNTISCSRRHCVTPESCFLSDSMSDFHCPYQPISYPCSPTLIARFMGPTWVPSGADRTQVGPMLAPWSFLYGNIWHGRRFDVIMALLLRRVTVGVHLGLQSTVMWAPYRFSLKSPATGFFVQ